MLFIIEIIPIIEFKTANTPLTAIVKGLVANIISTKLKTELTMFRRFKIPCHEDGGNSFNV